jgi:anti-sigma factor RsiW
MTGSHREDEGLQERLLIRRSARKCLTEKEIEDFLFDRLSGVTREAVEEHLLVCEACQDRISMEEEFVGTFRRAARVIECEELERAFGGDLPV